MKCLLLFFALFAQLFAAGPSRRIVSMSPTVTDLLYGIGAFDQVVGVTDYCTYPPAVKNLPRIGGWHNPSLEKLASLRPGLVIVDEGQRAFAEDRVRDLGLPILSVPSRTIADLYSAIAILGRATGHVAEADRLAAQTRAAFDRVARRATGLPKVKTVVIVDRTPGTLQELYTATRGSFLAELIDMAGGRIDLPAARSGYTKLTKEELLADNPDVIIDSVHASISRFAGDPIAAWKELPELKAVRTHRVYGVGEDYIPHASQRMAQTAEVFLRLLHPEAK
jgi:iron complex transport system substrate-binding protein